MATPFLGEISIFAGNFAPRGYAFCNGQLLAISQNDALFALIGTIYGGDGQSTFALPNLQGRVPVGQGQGAGLSNYVIGEQSGTETVTLIASQMPAHVHTVACNSELGTSTEPLNSFWAASANLQPYTDQPPNAAMFPTYGGNQPHENMPPFLVLNFIIALEGVFPSRN